jgi:hypothetical protein
MDVGLSAPGLPSGRSLIAGGRAGKTGGCIFDGMAEGKPPPPEKKQARHKPLSLIARMLSLDMLIGMDPQDDFDGVTAGTASPFGGHREGPLPPHLANPSPGGATMGWITTGADGSLAIIRAVGEEP